MTIHEPLPIDCGQFSGVLGSIGDRWTGMIVRMLAKRPRRFEKMKRAIGGIGRQMLARTLRGLSSVTAC